MAGNGKFKPGKSGNPNGRPRGSRNKIIFEVGQILKDNNCNPVQILSDIATANYKRLNLTPEQMKYFSVRLRLEAAAELLQYVAPKLKSVELTTDQENPVQVNLSFANAISS